MIKINSGRSSLKKHVMIFLFLWIRVSYSLIL
nr:MAG TPA: hypothetical protein [Caudoviricetes sp.]